MSPPITRVSGRCEDQTASFTNIILNILLLAFVAISYIPQYLRIIHANSSFGLSRLSAFMTAIGATSNLANILSNYSQDSTLFCCSIHALSRFQCVCAKLGILQVIAAWVGQTALFGLVEMYSPPPVQRVYSSPAFYTLIFMALLGPSIYYANPSSGSMGYLIERDIWRVTMFVVAAVLSVVEYIPQIRLTIQLQRVEGLSLLSLGMQMLVSFLLPVALALRFGWGDLAHIQIWVVFFVVGVFQAVLLGLGAYYGLRDGTEAERARLLPDAAPVPEL